MRRQEPRERRYFEMSTRTHSQRLMVMGLCLLLGSCSVTRPTVGPTGAQDLTRYVLIIQELPDGQVTHFWRPAKDLDLAQYQELLSRRRAIRRIVPVVWQRDCDEEMRQCINKCMGRNMGDNWEHLFQPPSRGLGGKHAECRKRCWPDYEDCNKQNAEDSAKAVEFPTIDKAVDWLKRHREELAVGAVVVIASTDAYPERDTVAVKP
jgi:hypothetical protein